MAKREKTDSITHLVKIVAKEVFYEEMSRAKEELLREIRSGLIDGARKDATNAGGKWSTVEDNTLEDELLLAIVRIARAHGRTVGSIRSRVQQTLSSMNF